MGKKKGDSAGAKKSGNSNKWLKPVVIAAILVGGLFVGLGINLGLSRFGDASGDKQLKKTANSGGYGKFPSYVTNSPIPNALQGYQFAVDYTEDLEKIPCFCGCGKHSGHKSVRYCFIEKDDPKGESIMFDRHGAGCKMCVDIVLDTAKGLQNGDSLKDIRARIEEQWKEDIDSMTPTPPIEG